MAFDRVEAFFAALDAPARAEPLTAAALQALARDDAARAAYLALTRDTRDPALRVRMVALARNLQWLDEAGERAELSRTVADVLATGAAGFGEVEMICGLNGDRRLDGELARYGVARIPGVAAAAALACMGYGDSRGRVLAALASPDEGEVQVAHAYLRHRPVEDGAELRALVARVAAMKAGPAQARALAAIARQHVDDPEALETLTRLFARSTNLAVQRAIAEIFIRARADARPTELATVLRRHRVRSTDGEDIIDAAIRLGSDPEFSGSEKRGLTPVS